MNNIQNNIIDNSVKQNLEKENILCKRVCLFTNARDEKHIREWAAHHLLIGFSKIIIFDHKSTTPLKEVFRNFDRRVSIINLSYLEGAIKMLLMNKAAKLAAILKMDWMIYLDADEFIILNKRFIGIKHLLSVYNHADSLGLNWLMFGSNNLEKDPDGLILENYTKSDTSLNQHLKSFTRPNKIINAFNPHYYNIKDKLMYFTVDNQKLQQVYHSCKPNISYLNAPAYIAHYVNQSEETYVKRKVNLPRDDTGQKRPQENIKEIHNQYNSIENTYPKNKYANKVKKFLKKYGHDF
jgi:hypothetical protein